MRILRATGDSVRLSLTFRDAPTVPGREEDFASFRAEDHFDKDANLAWRAGDRLVGAQPGQEAAAAAGMRSVAGAPDSGAPTAPRAGRSPAGKTKTKTQQR